MLKLLDNQFWWNFS